MEDNSTSDDEIKDSPASPKMGGKKLKLNDGSSQDSFKETASQSKEKEKDDNVDSGLSADKSESTSSEDPGAGPSEPVTSEIVHVGHSSNTVHTILLNIRRPRRVRNYRKRKTPDRDSESNESSQDSDDLSPEEVRGQADNTSEAETATFSDRSSSVSSKTSSDTNFDSSGSDDMVHIQSNELDSDDEEELWSNDVEETEENKVTPAVLSKDRPKHNYLLLREIINREMGLTFPCGKTAKDDVIFEQRFYGSLHAVYRLKKMHNLAKHRGCVNCINFHPEGQLLASGSDDTNVIVWDWAKKTALQTIKTGHKSNVFQSKFLHLNARSQLNIVTCARDGQVRLVQCGPHGGAAVARRRLASHYRAAHKLHVSPAEPHLVISAGEDGVVMRCDLRADTSAKLFQVLENGMYVPLYSVTGHPLKPGELLVAGRNKFVRVYDTRNPTQPAAMYCPGHFLDPMKTGQLETLTRKIRSQMHLTCAVYNHDGTEILGSYNDEDIYLFDAITDVYKKESTDIVEGYRHRYSGHRNSATFKGVAFFGPRSQYVVSGSDCSHVFVWERRSEAIVQWMQADVNGVVNCIETHPRYPVLATSGLDKDVKIWIPSARHDPTFDGMEKVVRENGESPRRPLFSDFLPTLYSAWRGEPRGPQDDDAMPNISGNIEFDGNVCTTF